MDTKLRSFRFSLWFKFVLQLLALLSIVAGICTISIADITYSYYQRAYYYADDPVAVLHRMNLEGYANDLLRYYSGTYVSYESIVREEPEAYYSPEIGWYYPTEPEEHNSGAAANYTDSGLRVVRQPIDPMEMRRLKERVEGAVNLYFIVRDLSSGNIYTNLNSERYPSFDEKLAIMRELTYNYEITPEYPELRIGDTGWSFTSVKDYNMEVYLGLRQPFVPGDIFYEEQQRYDDAFAKAPYAITIFCVSVIGFFVCVILLLVSAGRNRKKSELSMLATDRCYNDLALIIAGTLVIVMCALIVDLRIFSELYHSILQLKWEYIALIAAVILPVYAACSYYFLSVARHLKNRSFLRHTLIFTVCRLIWQGISGVVKVIFQSNFKWWSVAIILVNTCVSGFLMACFGVFADYYESAAMFFFLLGIIWIILTVFLMIKNIKSLDSIIKATHSAASGDLEGIAEIRVTPAFARFYEDIVALKKGYGAAVDLAIRGERMKTELVTNVSHDLKTPLTSIISYVELLKNEKLPEPSNGYVDILAQKSERLRRLCEDLFDAAKVSSGTVEVSREDIDIYELVRQIQGEYNDKTSELSLDIRLTQPETLIFAHADRRHTFRIVDNLFSNLCKYAQPGSRVYVEISRETGYAVLTMKNISREPLNIEAERLMERFVRGDSSRSEDGSGLGLAIVKGLCDLQGGSLRLTIDGDLYKASVFLPEKQ